MYIWVLTKHSSFCRVFAPNVWIIGAFLRRKEAIDEKNKLEITESEQAITYSLRRLSVKVITSN